MKRLKLLRLEAELSQAALAAAAHIVRPRISEFERGRAAPPPHSPELYRIAAALGWPVADAAALLDEVAPE